MKRNNRAVLTNWQENNESGLYIYKWLLEECSAGGEREQGGTGEVIAGQMGGARSGGKGEQSEGIWWTGTEHLGGFGSGNVAEEGQKR